MLTKIIDEVNKKNDTTNLTQIFKDSDYIQKNIEAFQHLRIRDYSNAKNSYKECVNISRELDDDYKFADSLANYGICQFFCGQLSDAVDSLESAYRISFRMQNVYDKNRLVLYLKILSNLALSFLALGKPNETLSYINNILDSIKKEKENSFNSKLNYLKQVLYIFFRVDSLVNYVQNYHKYSFSMNEKTVVTNENRESEEVHGAIIHRILFFLHKYLRENDLDSWIQCLSEEAENFKFIKDYNGYVFALFNQYSGLFVKNPEANLNSSKIKVSSLIKVLIGDKEKFEVEEKPIEKILLEMKEKMFISVEIYKKLYEYELMLTSSIQEISNDVSSYTGIETSKISIRTGTNSKIFVKLFLRQSLRALNEMEEESTNERKESIKQMKSQINFTMNLVEKDQLDINSLALEKIDPEITNSLCLLFENILYIRYKFKIKKYFKELMYETLGYRTREDLKFIKERKYEIGLINILLRFVMEVF